MPALGAILTAAVTPFHADGRVDDEAAVRLWRYLFDHGSDGLVIAGTTGESATLTDDEHVGLVALAVREMGDRGSIVAGAGSNDTRHACELAEQVTDAGVDAVLVVTPYYNKPNRRGIVAHYREVARATDKPILLYNIPSRTAVNMPPDLRAELAQIDGIEAVKQANDDDLQPIDGLQVYAGNDASLARTLDFGGAGGVLVSSHVVGDEMRRMVDEPENRAEIDASLQDVYAAMFVTSSPAPVKAAMNLLGVDVGGLRVLPLGGLGEIGKNMMVVELDGRIVLVDVGLRFPTAGELGIDLVLPDFSYLRDRVADLEAIVVTHGHEDHVGALPWVLRELGEDNVPVVYGGRLTMAMARSKLDEHKLTETPLEQLDPGEHVPLGPFELELVHMTHSIPDSVAVALHTELGTVLVTGDYKFDQTPVDGRPADVSRLAALGGEEVVLLCGDSTNADRAGFSPSESGVGPHLEEAFARCDGRIVVTCFASNIHRVQQVVDAAGQLGRKVALVGRSMRKNVNIGGSLGHIEIPQGMLLQTREIDDFPDHKLVVISTGSQGEPLSALRRMAHHDHPAVKLHEGDTVIFSATPVPGNERAVNETIDRLYHIGCDVVTTSDAPIHASGHGYAEELKLMLNLVRPRYLLPVHGDYKRLRLHADLADAVGMDPEAIFEGENGLPLEIDERGARFGERTRSGVVFVDGVDLGDPADAALRDRRMLSADGIFIVVATISEQDGRQVVPAEVMFRGVPFLEEVDGVVDDIRGAVDRSLAKAADEDVREIDLLQQYLHDDVATFVYERLRRRPMVLPVVVEV
jgi:ribonuclease J